MWDKIASFLAALFGFAFGYAKAKTDDISAARKIALDQAKKRLEIENEIRNSHSDPIARQRMRDKWSDGK